MNQAILIRAITIRPNGSSKLEPAADEAALRFRDGKKSHRKRAILIITDKTESQAARPDVHCARSLGFRRGSERTDHGRPRGTRADSEIVDKTGGTTIVAGNPGEAFRESVHYLRSGYTMYYALPEAAAGARAAPRCATHA